MNPVVIARQLLGWSVTCIGSLVLLGWLFHWPIVVQVHPTYVPMQVATALGMIATGVLVARPQRHLGLGVLLWGAWILLSIITPLLGPEAVLPVPWTTEHTPVPGRPAPNTGLCFLFIGAAYLARRSLVTARIFIGCTWIIAAFGLASYMAHWTSVSWGPLHTKMAVHTAFAFVLAAAGQFLAHEEVDGHGE